MIADEIAGAIRHKIKKIVLSKAVRPLGILMCPPPPDPVDNKQTHFISLIWNSKHIIMGCPTDKGLRHPRRGSNQLQD